MTTSPNIINFNLYCEQDAIFYAAKTARMAAKFKSKVFGSAECGYSFEGSVQDDGTIVVRQEQ